jgi:hypothetical protein
VPGMRCKLAIASRSGKQIQLPKVKSFGQLFLLFTQKKSVKLVIFQRKALLGIGSLLCVKSVYNFEIRSCDVPYDISVFYL